MNLNNENLAVSLVCELRNELQNCIFYGDFRNSHTLFCKLLSLSKHWMDLYQFSLHLERLSRHNQLYELMLKIDAYIPVGKRLFFEIIKQRTLKRSELAAYMWSDYEIADETYESFAFDADELIDKFPACWIPSAGEIDRIQMKTYKVPFKFQNLDVDKNRQLIGELFKNESYYRCLKEISYLKKNNLCAVDIDLLEKEALCSFETFDLANLLDVLHIVQRWYPGSASALFIAALQTLLQSKGRNSEEAIFLYKKVLKIDENHVPSLLLLGHSYSIMGDHEQSVKAYGTILGRIDLQNIHSLLALSSEYLKTRNLLLASANLHEAFTIQSHNPRVLNELGCLFYARNQFERAIESFNSALHHCPLFCLLRTTIKQNLCLTLLLELDSEEAILKNFSVLFKDDESEIIGESFLAEVYTLLQKDTIKQSSLIDEIICKHFSNSIASDSMERLVEMRNNSNSLYHDD